MSGPWIFRVLQAWRIVDGDTFDIQVDLGFRQFGVYRFRLREIDTPEIWRPKNEEELEAGRAAGVAAEEWFREYMQGETWVECASWEEDSFGRWLADFQAFDLVGRVSDLRDHLESLGFDWSDS